MNLIFNDNNLPKSLFSEKRLLSNIPVEGGGPPAPTEAPKTPENKEADKENQELEAIKTELAKIPGGQELIDKANEIAQKTINDSKNSATASVNNVANFLQNMNKALWETATTNKINGPLEAALQKFNTKLDQAKAGVDQKLQVINPAQTEKIPVTSNSPTDQIQDSHKIISIEEVSKQEIGKIDSKITDDDFKQKIEGYKKGDWEKHNEEFAKMMLGEENFNKEYGEKNTRTSKEKQKSLMDYVKRIQDGLGVNSDGKIGTDTMTAMQTKLAEIKKEKTAEPKTDKPGEQTPSTATNITAGTTKPTPHETGKENTKNTEERPKGVDLTVDQSKPRGTIIENKGDKPAEEVTLPANTESFKSPDGSIIIYGPYGEPMFLGQDGKSFVEVNQTGFGGTSVEHKISFENPHDGTTGEINRNRENIVFGGKSFGKEKTPPTTIAAIKLPEVTQSEYSLKTPDGQQISVTSDKYNYSYKSFKLSIGTGENMRDIPIKNVERFKDGGTTIITTAEGILISPSPFDKNLKPTWTPIEKPGADTAPEVTNQQAQVEQRTEKDNASEEIKINQDGSNLSIKLTEQKLDGTKPDTTSYIIQPPVLKTSTVKEEPRQPSWNNILLQKDAQKPATADAKTTDVGGDTLPKAGAPTAAPDQEAKAPKELSPATKEILANAVNWKFEEDAGKLGTEENKQLLASQLAEKGYDKNSMIAVSQKEGEFGKEVHITINGNDFTGIAKDPGPAYQNAIKDITQNTNKANPEQDRIAGDMMKSENLKFTPSSWKLDTAGNKQLLAYKLSENGYNKDSKITISQEPGIMNTVVVKIKIDEQEFTGSDSKHEDRAYSVALKKIGNQQTVPDKTKATA